MYITTLVVSSGFIRNNEKKCKLSQPYCKEFYPIQIQLQMYAAVL